MDCDFILVVYTNHKDTNSVINCVAQNKSKLVKN